MAPVPRETKDWLPELTSALRSIANALAGREPTPKRLVCLKLVIADSVPQHRVELHWLPHGYLYEPDVDEPGSPEYVLTISGHRLMAGWLIPAADLSATLEKAIST